LPAIGSVAQISGGTGWLDEDRFDILLAEIADEWDGLPPGIIEALEGNIRTAILRLRKMRDDYGSDPVATVAVSYLGEFEMMEKGLR
jgi:hypothetical protein